MSTVIHDTYQIRMAWVEIRKLAYSHLSFVATEVACVYLAVPQTCNLIPKRGYNCGCCLLDAGNFVDVTMVTVVLYYQSLWVLVHTQTQRFA